MSTDKPKKQLEDGLDGPCSALGLNCLQFACCLHDVPIASNYRSALLDSSAGTQNSNPDWMGKLCLVKPDIKLREIVLPGSHDAATDTIAAWKPFAAVSRTQNVSVLEQLQRGVRYLDIRMAGGTDDDCYVFHGFHQGAALSQILDQIQSFLQEHPGEFLFLEMVAEYGRPFSPEQRKKALDMIQSSLGDLCCRESKQSKLLNQISLKDLVDSNQRVCVLLKSVYEFELDGQIYNQETMKDQYPSFFDSGRWMYNRWHNTRNVPQLLEWNLEEVSQHGSDRNKILNNQFVMTPGFGGPQDILPLLLGMQTLRPNSLAWQLGKEMNDFMRKHSDEAWNILMMDFVDLEPSLISFLISLNFVGQNLTISKATVAVGENTVDVTDPIQQYVVHRNSVLYLTHVATDLKLDEIEGQLTIEYQVDGGDAQVLEVEFDEDTEVVLSPYTHGLQQE